MDGNKMTATDDDLNNNGETNSDTGTNERKVYFSNNNIVVKNVNPRPRRIYVNPKKFNKAGKMYEMKFFLNNCRGLQSKIDTVANILVDGGIDVALLCETHNQGSKNLKIPDYECYFHNRVLREKGGTAIYVHKKWGPATMKLETGLDHNEFFIIRIEGTEPNLILIIFYGVIESQFGVDEVRAMQADLFQLVTKYSEEGNQIFWCGDFNNSIGNNLGLKGNSETISQGGRDLVDFVTEQGLTLLNARDPVHTHFDRSVGTSKVLDFVFSNVPETVTKFEVDKTLGFTPYRLKKDKGRHSMVHSDHVGIKWSVNVTLAQVKSSKRVMWNMSKPNGGYRYEEATDARADLIENKMLETDDVDEISEFIYEMVDEAKTVAYGKITRTKSQLKRLSDKLIWRKRTKEVQKAIASVEADKFKTNDRIWEMRSRLSDKFSDQQFVGVKNPQTGEMTKTKEDTFQCILDYNYGLLRKDNEEEEELLTECQKELGTAKEEAVKLAFSIKEFEEDESLEYDDYLRVIEKVRLNNKNVYSDFMKSGEKFKQVIFKFFNWCYIKEIMPRSFYTTQLLKLYKGKGVRAELKSNRFIHLKPWMPKLYEKMLMTKIEGRMFSNTPDLQVGGQKQGSTNEHLLAMMISMRRLEEFQGCGSIIFMDIKACFDRVRLSDILFETIQCGVVGRPLKNIANYTENLVIKSIGDPKEDREARITNSTGQGSGFAPVGTSLVMAKTLEVRIKMRSESQREVINRTVNGITLGHNFFVDDLAKCCAGTEELVVNGEVITETLNELRLQAHADKSGVLVFGRRRDEFKELISKNPPRVQEFNLAFKQKETYLGMIFSEQGADDSLTLTIANRRVKCLTKAATIKRLLSEEKMLGVSWLVSATLLHSSIIMSTLTYGAAAMTGMKKKHWDDIESIQRHCLIHILGISQKSTIQTLLLVLGLLPAKDIIKKLQITFVNNLIHIKGRGQALRALREDDAKGDNKGLLAEVREYCREYDISDVTRWYVPPKEIRDRVEKRVMSNLWMTNVEARKPPLAPKREDCKARYYSSLPINKAKLALCYELGDLNFRASRKNEAMRKYGSIKCLVPHCQENDELSHVRVCDGYTAQMKDDDPDPFERIEYLAELEEERMKRFRRSLINHKTL